ncbi:unnamed protein product, partial [Mesorhabditis spiculigera]
MDEGSLEVDTGQVAAAVFVVLVCALGITINVFAFMRLKFQLKKAPHFTVFCRTHIVADTLILTSFLCQLPWQLVFPEIWQGDLIGQLFGFFNLAMEYCSFSTSMFLTVNRAAVLLRATSTSIFARVPALVMLLPSFVVLWIASGTYLWRKLLPGVRIAYPANYTGYHKSEAKWNVALGQQSLRRRNELRMFAQSSIASLGFVYMLVAFHFISGLVDHRFWRFFHTTLTWQFSHSVQG